MRRALLLALAVLLLPASPAGAATKLVWAGPPDAKAPPGAPAQADSNSFFPAVVTVAEGDTVAWRSATYHTITLPKAGETPPPFVTVDAADPVRGEVDAAGTPFHFNGFPNLVVPETIFETSRAEAYDGRALRNSGILVGPRSRVWKQRFTKRGTYTYLCVVHPGMKGTVRVRPRGAIVPSAASDRRAVRRQVAAWIRSARRNDRYEPPAGVVAAGRDSGAHTLQKFLPARSRVKVGGSLTFQMTPGTTEAHTVTFGPDDYLVPLAAEYVSAKRVLNPVANYPSDPFPLPPVDGKTHGNGFVNSGILDADPNTPLGDRVTFTFTRAGTYEYLCIIHPGMRGTVKVDPPGNKSVG